MIDGLAYDNPAGLAEPDALAGCEDLLEAGIQVIASINIQYVDELREQVEAITGKHVEQTVPLSLHSDADEIEIVDAPPGNRWNAHRRTVTGQKYEDRVSKLRELALVSPQISWTISLTIIWRATVSVSTLERTRGFWCVLLRARTCRR